MRFGLGGACLALSAALAACQSVTYRSDLLTAAQLDLNRQYALWKAQEIHAYDYGFFRVCRCPNDLQRLVTVTVADSTILAVAYADDSTAVPDSAFASYFTVDQLFGQIQVAVSLQVDSLVVAYDPVRHYPTRIVIDQDRFQEGDELALFAQDLKPKP